MHLVNKTRPGARTGHRDLRILNIKGPMMGHSISSSNDIRKRILQGNWTLATEKMSGADAEYGEKGEKKDINEWESDNKNITL